MNPAAHLPARAPALALLAATALAAFAAAPAPLAAPAAAPAPPPGYTVDWAQARSAPSQSCDGKSKEHACTVERTASDSTGARLLAIAEAVYPPRRLLVEIADREGDEMGSDTAGVALWWTQGSGPRRVPYAVTRSALDHYLRLTRKYRDGDYREPGAQRMFSSELVYRAVIARRASFAIADREFDDAYVASLALSWTYDDGTFVPTVNARRTVVFSAKGELLAVDGDGEAVEEVTFSEHRGMGRQTELRR